MKITNSIAVAAALISALVLPTTLRSQTNNASGDKPLRYRLVDLGTLGGPNSYLPLLPPFRSFLPAASLSQDGTFAGSADTSTPDPTCFNDDCFVSHAFNWRKGISNDLGALAGPGFPSSATTWISESGNVVGISENGLRDPLIGAPITHAVSWKDGRPIDLGTLDGGYESGAFAVNSAGVVVGAASNLVQMRTRCWDSRPKCVPCVGKMV